MYKRLVQDVSSVLMSCHDISDFWKHKGACLILALRLHASLKLIFTATSKGADTPYQHVPLQKALSHMHSSMMDRDL